MVRSSADHPVSWDIGDVIEDKYQVTGILGRGGMGRVYRVRHLGWGIDLAVKSPLPEMFTGPQDVDRFVAEAQAWVSLGIHPNVCCCHYVRVLGGVPRMFAEYVPGGSLRELIDDLSLYHGDASEITARMLRIAGQMARGLEHAHSRGVLHRDVKPGNVLLGSGEDGPAKITDFGLARAAAAVSHGSMVEGVTLAAPYSGGLTLAYASPEQAAGGSVGRRSDIYSLAVSVLEMFAGGVTWMGGPAAGAALSALLATGTPQPHLRAMPAGLDGLLERCLSVEPSARPASMTEVADQFESLYVAAAPRAARPARPVAVELRAAEHNNRALSLLDLGAPAEAEAEFGAALHDDPQHLDAVYNAGLLRWRNGEITDEDLLLLIQHTSEHVGDPWQARCMLAQVHLERGDLPSAAQILDYLTRGGHPDEPEVRAALHALDTMTRTDLDSVTPVQWLSQRDVKFSEDYSRLWTFGATFSAARRVVRAAGRLCVVQGDHIPLWDLRFTRDLATRDATLAESHDGVHLLLCTRESHESRRTELRVRHLDRDKKQHQFLTSLEGRPRAMAFYFDAGAAVIVGSDDTIQVFNLRNGECVQQFTTGTADFISEVDFSPDGRRLLSSAYGSVRLWDLATGRCLRTEPNSGPTPRDVWIRESGLSASVDDTVRPWQQKRVPLAYQAPLQLSRPRPVAELGRLGDQVRELVDQAEQAITASAYATAHRLLTQARAVPGHERDDRTLRAWRDLGRHLPRVGLHAAWTTRQLSGRSVSISADGRVAASSDHGRVLLWDLERGRLLGEHIDDTRSIIGVELSADGGLAVCAWDFGKIRVWSVRTGELLYSLDLPRTVPPRPDDGIRSVWFTGDGRRVLLGCGNGTLLLWDVESGRRVQTSSRHRGAVEALWADLDGRACVSAAQDSVRLWDLRTEACVREIPVEDKPLPRSVCLSPCGDLIVATWWESEPSMMVWDTAGRLVRTDHALTARFSADGRFIFVAPGGQPSRPDRREGTITVSEARSGRRVKALAGHILGVTDVRPTLDGRYALSSGGDGILRLWELDWDLAAPDDESDDA
jgi:WD40 repeat protein